MADRLVGDDDATAGHQLLYVTKTQRKPEEDLAALDAAVEMAREELRMNEALFKDGDVSRLEILRAAPGH